MKLPYWESHRGRLYGFCRPSGVAGVVLTLGLLPLPGAVSGCRPDSRPGLRTRGSEGPPVAIQDTGDGTHQLAEVERIGPGAKTDRAALVQLGRAIRTPRHEVANRAAYWLGQAGPPAVPILLASLADPSPLTRTSASYALGILGPAARAAVPALTRQMVGASDSAANMADWALMQIEPRGTGTLIPVLRTLRYGTPLERSDAALTLALMGEAAADAIPILVRSLADSIGLVAESASEALVRIGARSVLFVEAALLSDNPTVRARAVLVLDRIRPNF